MFALKYSYTRAVTCFPQPSVCRARIVAGSQQETRSAAETVLFAGAGPPHGDPLLWRHGQVATTAAVGRQHCSSGNRVSLQAAHSFCYCQKGKSSVFEPAASNKSERYSFTLVLELYFNGLTKSLDNMTVMHILAKYLHSAILYFKHSIPVCLLTSCNFNAVHISARQHGIF